ncbi:nucleoside diphosphate kinase regulator [Candidatus Saccharibacteria bacterium]|nr:nucleoside diphosphate kinase regulator [Candidatus Saccharibacteria bacterium]
MMKIHITQFDLDRLQKLLSARKPYDKYDQGLADDLENAEIVEPAAIPPDVITMNSTVRLTDEDGKDRDYSIVFPEDADLAENKISILSPVGYSMIGWRVGSDLNIPTPKGEKKLNVKEILYQPEKAGDFDR